MNDLRDSRTQPARRRRALWPSGPAAWTRLVVGLGLLGAVLVSDGRSASGQAPDAPPAATLPGGASSLTEIHDDWMVNCRIVSQSGTARKACTLGQQQINNTRQQVLKIELAPVETGARGVLILPFGLALQAGVALQVDTATPSPPLSFRTCLPTGCIVDIVAEGKQLVAWRLGTSLKVSATADGGQATPFSISLKGFSAALDRTAELLK